MVRKNRNKKRRRKFSLLGTTIIAGTVIFSILGVYFFLFQARSHAFCANSDSCIRDLSGKPEPATAGIFMGKTVHVPKAEPEANVPVLGLGSGKDKHIYVDLAYQRLYAYEGNRLVYDFSISSGRWAPTPTGDFTIWIKLRYTRMVGGNPSIGTYYNLPNVPYTMYFYNRDTPKTAGYGLHGAYWHNNFGHPMSHGCINIGVGNSKKLYDWADPSTDGYTTFATEQNPGTPVTIYGKPPASEINF